MRARWRTSRSPARQPSIARLAAPLLRPAPRHGPHRLQVSHALIADASAPTLGQFWACMTLASVMAAQFADRDDCTELDTHSPNLHGAFIRGLCVVGVSRATLGGTNGARVSDGNDTYNDR